MLATILDHPLFGVAFGAVGGGWLGYWLSRIAVKKDHRRQARGLLVALRTDIETGTGYFRGYRDDEQWAPAYRLPTDVWAAALPFLASIDALTAEEISTLARFFEISTQMNYCLDKQGEASYVENSAEIRRTRKKVSHALDQKDGKASLVDRARDTIEAAIARLDSKAARTE